MSALLKIQLIEAKDLVAKHHGETSNPVCRFAIVRPHLKDQHKPENSKKSDFKSKVQKKNLNPVWKEDLEIPVLYRDDILVIDCLDDEGQMHHDHSLGSAFIPISQQPKEKRLDLWVDLENVPSGKIHINLTVTDYAKDPLAGATRVAKKATHMAAKKVAMKAAEVAVEGTIAAPALLLITAASTVKSLWHVAGKAREKYNHMYESDPTALLPLKCECDPTVPEGESDRPIGRLEILFGKAEKLRPKGKSETTYPYCRISLNDFGGEPYRLWETGMQAKTLSPSWSIPEWEALYLAGSILNVVIMHKEFMSKDDFLGSATISIEQLIKDYKAVDGGSDLTSVTLPLCNKKGVQDEKKDRGSVSFSFRYKSCDKGT